MPKKCLVEGCNYNVFAAKLCKNHQYKRKDKKQKPIQKLSKKKQQSLVDKRTTKEKDWFFYCLIWSKRRHEDFETGEPIYGELSTLYMHHCLPKSKYPKLRYVEENIVIVSWATHSKAEANLDLVPKIKQYTEYLLKKYT